MLSPFFSLAAQSPTRQRAFRRAVCAHILLLSSLAWSVCRQPPSGPPALIGPAVLVAGIIEGAMLVGWRLTQLPKSQALEFLLVSPVRPQRLLLGEGLVGLYLLGLVTLSGLPVLLLLVATGYLDPLDPIPLLVMPFTWGAITGLGLTVWAYEPQRVRRWGERVAFGLVLLYLVVGVLAGENLKRWLDFLPAEVGAALLRGFTVFHTHNPFGVLQHWMENDCVAAWERVAGLQAAATLALALLLARAAGRLQGHFHELHYQPIVGPGKTGRPSVGDRPLRWWAVRRVTRYSGAINLYLAGGFGVLYAFYTVAGPYWPGWMGQRVFQICDSTCGLAGIATGLVLLAAVPAAFQYGLWDSNTQDRCRRLELLLLTRLGPRDYWDAAAAAAWRRGRGYFGVAMLLWVAAAMAGRMAAPQVAATLAGGVLLWAFYFALGFRAFARGIQANGLGALLTLGLPLGTYALYRLDWPGLAGLLPPGFVYTASVSPFALQEAVGPLLLAAATLLVARHTMTHCDTQLRRWYDAHHGHKVMT
jgi:hypothetical protein